MVLFHEPSLISEALPSGLDMEKIAVVFLQMVARLRAMHTGTVLLTGDNAKAADIALMRDDLSKIPYLKRLSNATVNTIKLSITLSMCINFAAIVLSLLELLNPTTGALVHNAGSCFVVLIAALLYDRKFE